MLIVQQFHSVHEIDPEFILSLENLLQEDFPHFDFLKDFQDSAPKGDLFTYFLFFGPTQNSPIGFAQLIHRPLPTNKLISLSQKLSFWNKDYLLWKELIWKIGAGTNGFYVFDPRYQKSGKEKMAEILKEYEKRDGVKAQLITMVKGLQDFKSQWIQTQFSMKERFVLEPLMKAYTTYQEYVTSLDSKVQKQIKESWKKLHKQDVIQLGDYSMATETPPTLPIPEETLKRWEKWKATVLTFEKDLKILGCLLVITGKNGNIFFEPIPFEPQESPIVPDELYTQYALLKFFEMPEARKCHMMKFGQKLIFDDKEDLKFFQIQNFQSKTIQESFYSTLEKLNAPV